MVYGEQLRISGFDTQLTLMGASGQLDLDAHDSLSTTRRADSRTMRFAENGISRAAEESGISANISVESWLC